MGVSVMATVAAVNEAQQSINPPMSGGQTAGGLALAVAVGTVPIWRQWLALTSELAAEVAPILGALIAVATLWRSLRGHADRLDGKPTPAGTAGKLASAAGAAARRSPLVGASVAVAAVVAALLWALTWSSAKARAEPALPPAAVQPAKGRRKAKDDAGEDGEAFVPEGKGEPAWLTLARSHLGQHEGTARKPNPLVQDMFKAARPEGAPLIKNTVDNAWCAAAVCYWLAEALRPNPRTMMARDFEGYGVELAEPRIGCIVVMWRERPTSWKGHVGLYVGENATHVFVLGGNQSDSVSIAQFPKNRVLSYRWPKSTVDKKAVAAGAASAVAGGGAVVAAANSPDVASGPAMPVSPPPALEAVQAMKGPLAELGAFWKPAAIAAAVLGIACAAYMIYRATKPR